jgi:hypothetical protein
MDNVPFISAALRNWKSFVPAWVLLLIAPIVLLAGADNDRLLLYFWVFVAPSLAVALWPLAGLWRRGVISNVDIVVWAVMIPLCAAAGVGYAYQFLKGAP